MASEASRLLNEMQSGQYIPTDTEAEAQEELIKNNIGTPVVPRPGPLFEQMRLPKNGSTMRNENVTREAVASGWGESKYDTGEFVPGMDVENRRALEQGYFSKIGTGLMKGGVTAAATAVNTTIGTVFGLGSALFELATDAEGDGRGVMDTIDAGTNNWLSTQMIKLQDWSEKQFPNYRTAEERTEKYQREWWKHIGSANFIGDSILKNFGFTVGAMVGGMAWTKLIGAGMTKALANNVMKGAIAAAEGDAEASAAMARAVDAIKRGTAVAADYETVIKNSKSAAVALNKMDARLQLYGSVIGAMGEGTTEGLMAKNEFLEGYMRELNDKYISDIQGLEQKLISELEDTDMVRKVLHKDGSTSSELNDKGLIRLQEEKDKLSEQYIKERDEAEKQSERLASTTYLLNLPVLTASNAIQFGRMFSGGWNTSRKTAAGITGGAQFNPMAEGKIPTINGNYASELAGKGSVAGKTILNSLKVAGTEANEEMSQGAISSGAKRVAENRLSSFNDAGYDAAATDSVRQWFEGMYSGASEYLGDIKNWQEGFLGAVTGLFGIPGKRWNGGVVQAYKDAQGEVNASRSAADNLNALVNSKEFRDRWLGYIRHLKYDNDMKDAVDHDDEYAWHSANDEQLINDVMMFADAGKLEDLNQIVSGFAGISEADATGIRDAVKQENGEEGWTKNLSDAEVVEKVKKQANNIQETIKEYKETYDALSARAPIGTSPEFLKELVFTSQQVKAFDRRFLTLFGEVMGSVEPILHVMSAVSEDNEVLSKEEADRRFQNVRDSYERILAGSLLPVRMPPQMEKAAKEALDLLEELSSDDNKLHKKITDIRKLSEDRKNFYKKYQTLQDDKAEDRFNESAVTPEKVEKAAEEAAARIETKDLNSLDDVKRQYFSRDAKGKADFLTSLEGVEDSNPHAKVFLKLKRRFDGFQEYITNNPISSPDITVTPPMIQSAVNDLIRRSRNEDELINLPDNVFAPQEQFNTEFQSPFGPTSPTAYSSVKQAIRAAMNAYIGVDSATASRSTVSPTPEPQQPVGAVSTPEGYDAAQPAAMEPAPEPKAETPEERQIKDAFKAVAEGLKEALSDPKLQADFEKRFLDWLNTPEVNDAFKSYGQKSKTVEELIRAAKEDNPDLPAYMKKSLDKALTSSVLRDKLETFIPKEKQPEQEPVPAAATPVELASDAIDAVRNEDDFSVKGSEEKISVPGEKEKTAHLRMSIPETETEQANKARKAIENGDREALMQADLSDFVKNHPEYADVWNALQQRDAFNFVSTELNVGDEVEFIVDPSFPTYNGKYQILVTTKRGDARHVLTVLSTQGSRYYGLNELRKAIDEEYSSFREAHPNDVFVFSKKSLVWAKRAGLIDYDFSGNSEKGIINIPGYQENAPIVFINRNGDPVVVRGEKSASEKMPLSFNDAARNRGDVDGIDRRGNLYYLAPSGNGRYIPIRLNVEHFNEENKTLDNPLFEKIRTGLRSIVDIVKASNNTNLSEQNEKLHKTLESLVSYLDLSGIFFEIGEYENVGTAIRINDGTDSVLRRPDQITEEWLTDLIAKYNRSIQVKLNTSGNLQNLSQMVETGILTSNARLLRAKQVDFYFNTYNPATGKFEALTPNAIAANEELANEMPYGDGELPGGEVSELDADFGDRDDFSTFDKDNEVPTPRDEMFGKLTDSDWEHIKEVRDAIRGSTLLKEAISMNDLQRKFGLSYASVNRIIDALVSSEEIYLIVDYGGRYTYAANLSKTDPVLEMINKPFAELPIGIQDILSAKGWTAEEFDKTEPILKEKAIRCAGA